jgi:hypothetical protein
MIKRTRAFSAIIGLLCVAALLATGASALAATGKSKGKADTGTSYVGTTHAAGGFSYLAGGNTDKLLGTGAVTFKVKTGTGSKPGTVTLTIKPVELFTATGALTGTGSATLTVVSTSSVTITNGKLDLTKGTGSQKGHSLVGTYTGTGDPATGQYVFHYKATYK